MDRSYTIKTTILADANSLKKWGVNVLHTSKFVSSTSEIIHLIFRPSPRFNANKFFVNFTQSRPKSKEHRGRWTSD